MEELKDEIRDEIFEAYDKCFKIYQEKASPKILTEFREMIRECLEEVIDQRQEEMRKGLVGIRWAK